MNERFSIDEIFQMAERVEINGEKFYREAAKQFEEYSGFLTELADEEIGHRVKFKAMRDKYREKKDHANYRCDEDELTQLYLNSLADSKIFLAIESFEDYARHIDGISELIDHAIMREKESVLFFYALLDSGIDEEDQLVIKEVVREEMTHITWLTDKKKVLVKKDS